MLLFGQIISHFSCSSSFLYRWYLAVLHLIKVAVHFNWMKAIKIWMADSTHIRIRQKLMSSSIFFNIHSVRYCCDFNFHCVICVIDISQCAALDFVSVKDVLQITNFLNGWFRFNWSWITLIIYCTLTHWTQNIASMYIPIFFI